MLEINHTSSASNSTPTFTNPIDVRFSRLGQVDTIIRFAISSNSNQFYVPNVGQVTNLVSIDPNNWIINKMGTKQFDASLQVNGIADFSEQHVIMYPNPADTKVNFKFPNESTYEACMFSANGEKVLTHQVSNGQPLDVSKLAAGIYTIELSQKGIKQFRESISIR